MTTKDEQLVLENINMAYDIAWTYYRKFGSYAEYDEFKSEALVGLVKAAKTFKPDYNLAFSTYAYKVMQNEILLFLRNIRKNQASSIYIELFDNLELVDTLTDGTNIDDALLDKYCLKDLSNYINALPERLRDIIKYRLAGMTMIEIGKKLNLSQPQISRDYHTAINRLKTKLKHWR